MVKKRNAIGCVIRLLAELDKFTQPIDYLFYHHINSVSALATLGSEGPIEGLQYLMAVLSFFTVVFGGLSVGFLTGVFSAFVLKSTRDVRQEIQSWNQHCIWEVTRWCGKAN